MSSKRLQSSVETISSESNSCFTLWSNSVVIGLPDVFSMIHVSFSDTFLCACLSGICADAVSGSNAARTVSCIHSPCPLEEH